MRSTPVRLMAAALRSGFVVRRWGVVRGSSFDERRTPNDERRRRSSPRPLMHVPRERLHVLDGGRGQNTVAEIEDVAGSRAGARQDLVGCGKYAIERPEQQCRIEVSLNAA